ncbi:MAG: 2-dehydropantoate 2-reductase [Gemmatimonadetes bacterium]|nr:2-dehydropantoate 2-reductase [Gemmatimonadota bacterium]
MKIGIVGTGAMGSIYAAILADGGNEVWAFDKWKEHINAIGRAGLRLEGSVGDRTVRMNATTVAAEAGPCALVVVATKAFDAEQALRDAAPMIGPETIVLPIQNGLGNGERVAALLGPVNVLVGIAAGWGSHVVAPGHVHPEGSGAIHLAELRGGVTPRLEGVADVWRAAGFRVELYGDPQPMIWGKLIANVGLGGASAMTGFRIGELLDNPWAWSLTLACVRETAAVAAAKGIKLPYDDPEAWITRFAAKIRDATTSLAIDFRAGRPTEIDSLQGAVAREGETLGVPTPTCRVLHALVKALEGRAPAAADAAPSMGAALPQRA